MPDQRGNQPTVTPTEELDPAEEITGPEHSNPSADGGEPETQVIRPASKPRSQIRAAINSIYSTRLFTSPETEKSPAVEPKEEVKPPALDPEELKKAAELQNLLAKGQLLARQGQLNEARQMFGQAVRLDPASSEAWTWLGGLLIDSNLERARLCLEKAIELDDTNERARRGLAQVEDREQSAPVAPDRQLAVAGSDTELAEVSEEQARPELKIGLEEVVSSLRQSGQEADPENIPLGGALIRPAVEKGELKLPKVRRRKRRSLFDKLNFHPTGYQISLTVLSLFIVVCLIGIVLMLLPPPPPAPEPSATPEPTATPVPLTSDEVFAGQLRGEMDHYARAINNANNLRQQVQKGKLAWEDYRRSVHDLQTDIKNEKKAVDSLAAKTTPRLIPYYREFQNVVAISIQAVDYTMSGVENTNPEDLEEGNSQFSEAGRRLANLSTKLNEASPIPTPVPTPTPRPTSTPVPPSSGPQPTGDTTPAPGITTAAASPGVSSPAAGSIRPDITPAATPSIGTGTTSPATTSPSLPPATPTP